MRQQELFDVTIIGGGPAGLYSAFYSGLREMKTKLIEFQPELGGKLNVYPEKMIWDVGGQPPITGEQFKDQLVKQGLLFHPTVLLNEKVESIHQDEEKIFVLQTSSGQTHYSKTIIVAIGSGILQPQKLTLEDASKFEMSNLHYTVKSLKRFKDKVVLISGGGDAAIDWANELQPVAKQVYLACRRNDFTCHEAQRTQIKQSSIISLFHTSITKLMACKKQEAINCVELTNKATDAVSHLEVDEVIISHGFDNDNSLIHNSKINVELVDNYYIKGTATSESSIDGFYAAGDILMHDGKLNLIAGCFQDAANAVNKAKQYIQPQANKTAMVSSHNDIFKEQNRVLVKQMMNSVTNNL
ncbi:NAD(P)/FAD-dependent oxidoreductase [Shimazuella kribbensis]|uniref:NAD(P)/FAD-dependent oxidoreductase n=1 Tax=Shimazuella kribbensis TaxID=139808 RepID=UPI00041BCCB2|nr:NAD(P)/FAD-dependent oxidoreductase [Shimazuella kribbensis]